MGRLRLISRKFESLWTYLASYLIGRLFFRSALVPAGPARVMVFKLDNAGDVVLSSLVMPRVSEMLGKAEVVYVVKKGFSGLLSRVDCVTGVIELPAGLGHCSRVGANEKQGLRASRKIIKQAIKDFRPHVIIDLRPTQLGNYGALLGRFLGVRRRVSLDRQRLSEIFGRDKTIKWRRHEVESFCSALEDAGVFSRGSDYRSWLTFWKDESESWLRPKSRYFLLQPGAVWEYKKWPERNYSSLIDSLAEYYPEHFFVLAGSADEKDVCSRVREMTGKKVRERVLNFAGKTAINELVELVSGSEMVIANDSGVAHIAGAAGIKTVVFFGPSSPERFMPLSERQKRVKVFHHKLSCNPCDQDECREGPQTYCLARINPMEVVEYIRSSLGTGEERKKIDTRYSKEPFLSYQ
ncbi:MAG: glycosyltransferase family 9 protein [Deltaproteobacteria bacterium]|nr:glycosyltransferase family 9 protein [Deltaproteobacteria bacterium]